MDHERLELFAVEGEGEVEAVVPRRVDQIHLRAREFSTPALRRRSLNFLCQVALYLPSELAALSPLPGEEGTT